jgi:hypothetical protein
MKAKVTVCEVTKRPTYELVSLAGDDRPVYVGSTKWREQAANPKESNK